MSLFFSFVSSCDFPMGLRVRETKSPWWGRAEGGEGREGGVSSSSGRGRCSPILPFLHRGGGTLGPWDPQGRRDAFGFWQTRAVVKGNSSQPRCGFGENLAGLVGPGMLSENHSLLPCSPKDRLPGRRVSDPRGGKWVLCQLEPEFNRLLRGLSQTCRLGGADAP